MTNVRTLTASFSQNTPDSLVVIMAYTGSLAGFVGEVASLHVGSTDAPHYARMEKLNDMAVSAVIPKRDLVRCRASFSDGTRAFFNFQVPHCMGDVDMVYSSDPRWVEKEMRVEHADKG